MKEFARSNRGGKGRGDDHSATSLASPARGGIRVDDFPVLYAPDLSLVLHYLKVINSREKIGTIGRTVSGTSTLALYTFLAQCSFAVAQDLKGLMDVEPYPSGSTHLAYASRAGTHAPVVCVLIEYPEHLLLAPPQSVVLFLEDDTRRPGQQPSRMAPKGRRWTGLIRNGA
ncbi:hypothetical protein MKEN_01348200 [Mycena kentingensis (nom. inval.)]|nr:hypothetical protein MKEN_01348200 [Mycena kentingensis (nom. inval.)]